MEKVIVTGASSMIASNLIKELIAENTGVYAIVRPRSEKIGNLPKSSLVHIIECDIKDLDKADIKDECTALFHFAWAGTGGAARQDAALQDKNVEGTIMALELAKRRGAKVFVTAGSQAEYGAANERLSENTPLAPDTEYGKAKIKASDIAKEFCEKNSIRHIHFRILSVYGAGDNGFTMVKGAITKMLGNEDTAFTSGEQMWDYLNAKDAARAILIAANKASESGIFVLGSGKCRKLKEYINIIAEETGYKKEIGFGKLPDGKIKYLCADISKLKSLGFEPKVDFREGIREMLKEDFDIG